MLSPLPDDLYTLTINDTAIVDVAGNKLDGESNAMQPNGSPMFPSGDGQPGGNFVARFTVDTRPDIGTYAAGGANIDINGNLTWDPTNPAANNRDLTFTLGVAPSLQGTISPIRAFTTRSSPAIFCQRPRSPPMPALRRRCRCRVSRRSATTNWRPMAMIRWSAVSAG